MAKHVDASPPPTNHIGTLSRVGYSFNSAVADIVDNSIAASASRVEIIFANFDSKPGLIIFDNGRGMSSNELQDNMVVGCKNPEEDRDSGDLGRFGSGLKTASFSQAKILTVCSWVDGQKPAAARWDTELVKKQNKWLLEILDEQELYEVIGLDSFLSYPSGTLVVWEKLSFLDKSLGDQNIPHQIAKACTELGEYLSLYFHRFMGRGFSITLNSKVLKPLDPFMKDVKGYEEGPSHYLRAKSSKILIQSHILPRLDNLTHEQLDRYGGAKEIARKQGLYVYRDRRLILAGGWYGLASYDELGKLTRIQIDIPASLDSEWKTDVKKSSLKIPPKIRQVLKRVIPSPKKRSAQVHKYKGREEEHSDLWSVVVNELGDTETVRYLINTDNSTLKSIYSDLPEDSKRKLAKYLLDLASELPINHIYATKASKPKSIVQESSDEELDKLLEQLK